MGLDEFDVALRYMDEDDDLPVMGNTLTNLNGMADQCQVLDQAWDLSESLRNGP